MKANKILYQFKRNLSNLPGWNTKRKIVVFESDDWGSIRMSSLRAFEELKKLGLNEGNNHYNVNDSLESNSDLEYLFETLHKFRDSTGKTPVFTGVNIVANPDFEKIKAHNYNQYFYEPFTETLKRYPSHDNVYCLWKEGISKRLFVPIFHGREHLNVQRWLKSLQSGNKSVLAAFEYGITGISQKGIDDEKVPNLQAAFDIDSPNDTIYLKEVLITGLDLFKEVYGYHSRYFVPTNGPFNNSLEKNLDEKEVEYINTSKIQKEPLGEGKIKKHFRYIGKQNSFGQIYLTRNCFFEPSSTEHSSSKNWIDNCLYEIQTAFRWNKPATISSHRVNYIGFLHPHNRDTSLRKLEELLKNIIKRWPDVEFMTSVELGDLIKREKKV